VDEFLEYKTGRPKVRPQGFLAKRAGRQKKRSEMMTEYITTKVEFVKK
jgi:hypothetical protein